MTTPSILVIDVGTTGLRAALVNNAGHIIDVEYRKNPPSTPFAGLVEFDALHMFNTAHETATAVLRRNPNTAVGIGITNQRASTIVWNRITGEPLGPAIGWQDLRTVMECITARAEHGLMFAPNQTATKAAWMLKNYGAQLEEEILRGDICIGTIDTWLTWKFTAGKSFVTDHTNAGVTGLFSIDTLNWSERICGLLNIPLVALPTIVASSQVVGLATELDNLPIAALVGDQQASLVGQGCITPGSTKITFGTGGMLDMYTGTSAPTASSRSTSGTFPIVAFSLSTENGKSPTTEVHWGVEAIMLSAGSNIEWLIEDMALITSAEESAILADSVPSSDGVMYVPALFGLGTPHWDYGARGALFGITRGTTRAHIVRAVLEGVAHRGADLYDAARHDAAQFAPPNSNTIHVDGGMSKNSVFVQALANSTSRTIEVSPVTEATTLGAAFLAGTALGLWPTLLDATSTWNPENRVESTLDGPATESVRSQWTQAVSRSQGWIPDLSALDF
ncbi:MAG: FGGY family carbohydrate kinase [Actinomycetes bacterium]